MQLVLLLGGNIGDREYYLREAIRLIGIRLGTVLRSSAIYRTAAWGNTDQPDFYNQVIICRSDLQIGQIMPSILNIETELGRIREEKWAARTIDIDVLLIDDQVIDSEILQVPHPRMAERRFVLEPLAELLPDYQHPLLHLSIQEILLSCEDPLATHKLSDI